MCGLASLQGAMSPKEMDNLFSKYSDSKESDATTKEAEKKAQIRDVSRMLTHAFRTVAPDSAQCNRPQPRKRTRPLHPPRYCP